MANTYVPPRPSAELLSSQGTASPSGSSQVHGSATGTLAATPEVTDGGPPPVNTWFDTGLAPLSLLSPRRSRPEDDAVVPSSASAEEAGLQRVRRAADADDAPHVAASPPLQRGWFVLPWSKQPVTAGALFV